MFSDLSQFGHIIFENFVPQPEVSMLDNHLNLNLGMKQMRDMARDFSKI